MDAPSSLTPAEESRALTGLRGLAALLVMVHHFKLRLGLGDHLPLLQWLLQKGYLGVDLFFVLSGFVMAMTYGTWFDGSQIGGQPGGLTAYARFLVRRIARLWPLHAAMIGAYVIPGVLAPAFPYPRNTLATNLLLIQSWGLSAAINPPAWSVSTEMFAYTAFPLLVALALKGRAKAALTAFGIAAAYGALIHLGPPLGPGRRGPLDIYFNYSWLPVLRCTAGFALGMLTWRISGKAPLRRIARHAWAAPCALAAMLALMMGRANDLWIVALLPVLVLATHCGRGPFYRALGYGPLHRLGLLSYAVYLTHLLLLSRFPFGPTPLVVELLAYLALTFAAAALAHALVEVPGRRLVRRAGEHLVARIAARSPSRPLHHPPR